MKYILLFLLIPAMSFGQDTSIYIKYAPYTVVYPELTYRSSEHSYDSIRSQLDTTVCRIMLDDLPNDNSRQTGIPYFIKGYIIRRYTKERTGTVIKNTGYEAVYSRIYILEKLNEYLDDSKNPVDKEKVWNFKIGW